MINLEGCVYIDQRGSQSLNFSIMAFLFVRIIFEHKISNHFLSLRGAVRLLVFEPKLGWRDLEEDWKLIRAKLLSWRGFCLKHSLYLPVEIDPLITYQKLKIQLGLVSESAERSSVVTAPL